MCLNVTWNHLELTAASQKGSSVIKVVIHQKLPKGVSTAEGKHGPQGQMGQGSSPGEAAAWQVLLTRLLYVNRGLLFHSCPNK